MISNIKRNKTLIKSCANFVEDSLKNRSETIEKSISVKLDNRVSFSLPFSVTVYDKNVKIVTVEDSKGRVNIGIDTSKARLTPAGSGVINNTLYRVIITVYSEVSNYIRNQAKPNVIVDILKQDGDYDNIEQNLINHVYMHEQTSIAIQNSKLYKDMEKRVEEFMNTSKVHLELQNDAFKFVTSNRSFIPVMILDFEKGTMNYTFNKWVSSDRQGRESDLLEYFIKGSKRFEKGGKVHKRLQAPISLVNVVVD